MVGVVVASRRMGGAVRVREAVRVVGVVGVVWVVRVRRGPGGGVGGEGVGGSGHALAAFKYSLNTYKNL